MGNMEKTHKMGKHRWKAAGLDDLVPAVIAFVLIAIVGAIGALILTGFSNTGAGAYCVGSGNVVSGTTGLCVNTVNALNVPPTFYNTAGNTLVFGQQAIGTIMSFLPLLGLVTIAAAIIAVVLYAFAFKGGAGRGETY